MLQLCHIEICQNWLQDYEAVLFSIINCYDFAGHILHDARFMVTWQQSQCMYMYYHYAIRSIKHKFVFNLCLR